MNIDTHLEPDLDPKKYIWEWERPAFPYYFYIFAVQWLQVEFSPPVYCVIINEHGTVNAYLNTASLERAGNDIVGTVEQSGEYFSAWSSYVYQTAAAIHKLCDELQATDLARLNDEELLTLLGRMFEAYKNHDDNVSVIRNANRELQKRLEAHGLGDHLGVLLASTEKSLFMREHESLLRIADEKRSGQDIGALLARHARDYYYLPCGYYGEAAYTENDFNASLEAILAKGETVALFDAQWARHIAEREEALEKLRLDPAIRRLVDFGSACTYLKDFIRGNLNRLQYFNQAFFTEVARRKNATWQDIATLVYPEIVELLQGKRKIEERRQIFLYTDTSGAHWFTNGEAGGFIKRFNNHAAAVHPSEIKGTPANRGIATGKVKIIRRSADLKDEKDFILVSPMTTPDLMAAMKRSLAIVTDEGGLTCHAAIVSRELHIPCIIGTRNATKVLKDGDMVEVDAEKGTVTVLSRT